MVFKVSQNTILAILLLIIILALGFIVWNQFQAREGDLPSCFGEPNNPECVCSDGFVKEAENVSTSGQVLSWTCVPEVVEPPAMEFKYKVNQRDSSLRGTYFWCSKTTVDSVFADDYPFSSEQECENAIRSGIDGVGCDLDFTSGSITLDTIFATDGRVVCNETTDWHVCSASGDWVVQSASVRTSGASHCPAL